MRTLRIYVVLDGLATPTGTSDEVVQQVAERVVQRMGHTCISSKLSRQKPPAGDLRDYWRCVVRIEPPI